MGPESNLNQPLESSDGLQAEVRYKTNSRLLLNFKRRRLVIAVIAAAASLFVLTLIVRGWTRQQILNTVTKDFAPWTSKKLEWIAPSQEANAHTEFSLAKMAVVEVPGFFLNWPLSSSKWISLPFARIVEVNLWNHDEIVKDEVMLLAAISAPGVRRLSLGGQDVSENATKAICLSEIRQLKCYRCRLPLDVLMEYGVQSQIASLEINECGLLHVSHQEGATLPPKLRKLFLSSAIDGGDLALASILAPLSDLESLIVLSDENIGPSVLRVVCSLPHLTEVKLSGGQLKSSELLSLNACQHLEVLSLLHKSLDFETAKTLAALPNLRQLDVSASRFTKDDIERLSQTCPQVIVRAVGFRP